jgi:hypothetical protein
MPRARAASHLHATLRGGEGLPSQPGGAAHPPMAEATKTSLAVDYALNSLLENEVTPPFHSQDAGNPGESMRRFDLQNLPVLTSLAKEFVIRDHWFSSMAGPAEPNRMLVYAATSGD